MDDPEALVNLVEVSGFAQSGTATAPASVSGPIGTGAVNALFLKVAQGGVKPDHSVPRPPTRQDASRKARSMAGANAVNIDPWTDPVLIAAVKLLTRPPSSF